MSLTVTPASATAAALRSAIESLAGVGGTVDCTGLAPTIMMDSDVFLNTTGRDRITVEFGRSELLISATQTVPSNLEIHLDGTRMVATADISIFRSKLYAGTGDVSPGTDPLKITILSDPAPFEYRSVDSIVAVFGPVPMGGADAVKLAANVSSSAPTLSLSSVAGLPNPGTPEAYLKVNNEIVRYTAWNQSFKTITVTRGALGTTSAAHSSGTTISRSVFKPVRFKWEAPSALRCYEAIGARGDELPLEIGIESFRLTGHGLIDLRSLTSKSGIEFVASSRVMIDHGIKFLVGLTAAVDLTACADSDIHGMFCGDLRLENPAGIGVRLRRGSLMNRVVTRPRWLDMGTSISDREVSAHRYDNLSKANLVHHLVGSRNRTELRIVDAEATEYVAGAIERENEDDPIVEIGESGWIEPIGSTRNCIELPLCTGVMISDVSSMLVNSTLVSRRSDLVVEGELASSNILMAPASVLSQSENTIDVALSRFIRVTGSIGTTNLSSKNALVGQQLILELRNPTNFPIGPFVFDSSFLCLFRISCG